MKDVLEQLGLADEFAALWEGLMPDIDAPSRSQFLIWAGGFPGEIVIRGINRSALKRARMNKVGQPMTAEDCCRYASSVMRNEACGHRRHERSRPTEGTL